jgi:hypothetical protein
MYIYKNMYTYSVLYIYKYMYTYKCAIELSHDEIIMIMIIIIKNYFLIIYCHQL